MIQFVLAAAMLGLMLAQAGPAAAQPAYPARPIELIIPFPPGGPADTAARIIQPKLSAALGVPLALLNKPGGGGALAADYVAKSKPDGYTVFVGKAPSAWRTLDEFVEYARKNPGKLSYGSAGLGTVSFFAFELFKNA